MSALPLAWRLAGRELRAGVRGFRVLIAALALGVAAIAGVGSVSEAIFAGIRADATSLLGGDVDLRLHNRPPTAEEAAFVRRQAVAVSETTEMRAMARPAEGVDGRSLVELKAVDGRYPLVGSLVLDPPMPLSPALAAEGSVWGAVADANLLRRLGVGLGGRVRVGEATFAIRAAIVGEPDRVASVFSFGPRLMIAAAALPATGLVQPGSQIHHHLRVRLPSGLDAAAWIEELRRAFPSAGWRIHGIDQAAPGIQRFIDRMTLFLGFVGLTALLVGGIGVANAVANYLEGKTTTIATLKCLGAPGALVFRVYLLQVLALAGVGIGLGLVLGAVAPMAALAAVSGSLPVKPALGLFPMPLAVAVAFGFLTALTFALWPLARARDVAPARLFRHQVAPAGGRPRLRYLAATLAAALALAGLTVLTANDRAFAYWFVGGAAATLGALRAGAAALASAAARIRRPRLPEWRLAVGNLHRPGAVTASVVLSLGLGLSVLVAVALVETNLSRQINERLPEAAPAFFFIDIQPHQLAAFDAAVTGIAGTRGFARVPSLRGRIVAIAGAPVETARIAPDSAWAVEGDRALTYAAERPRDARIVAGRWWPPDYRGEPLISLDAGLARGFEVAVGDTLTVNVLGREITATIASLREIDWRSLRFDFAIIFAPGALESAPQTHIAAVQAPPEAEDKVERAAVEGFPNVSAIRVREALEAAARILAGVGTAVRATAAIGILAGALVLAGAIAAGRRRRVYDAVVFKVLGATRATVLKAFLIEYGLLGLATGTIAAAVGTLTAWAVVVFVMKSEWTFSPAVAVTTVAACLAVTVIGGFAGTWRALGEKAAPILRNQ